MSIIKRSAKLGWIVRIAQFAHRCLRGEGPPKKKVINRALADSSVSNNIFNLAKGLQEKHGRMPRKRTTISQLNEPNTCPLLFSLMTPFVCISLVFFFGPQHNQRNVTICDSVVSKVKARFTTLRVC